MTFDIAFASKYIIPCRSCVAMVSFCLIMHGCHANYSDMANETTNNSKSLSRTISMLKNGESPNTQYRVLFYGQSITSSKWTSLAAHSISQQYPNVNFRFANMAIGGNAASLLKRAVERDISEFYPDLVIFHDYGGEQDYDDIVRTIRSVSAAEVILQTDHLTAWPEPKCPVGLNITFHTPPGCRGTLWLHQKNWDDYMSGVIIPRIAARYGTAIDPRRDGWTKYLKNHHLEPYQILQDGVHPTDMGWRLAATLFTRFFNKTVDNGTSYRQNLVSIHHTTKSMPLNFKFHGNRIEIISSKPLSGSVKFIIDGQSSDKIPGCWITTRTSPVPWIGEWPAIRQVNVAFHRLEENEWVAKVSNFNNDLTNFKFKIYSKLHGYDGEGSSSINFTSNSGEVKIDKDDWVLGYAMRVRPVIAPKELTLRWSRHNVCGYRLDNEAKVSPVEYHYIIGTGLDNKIHTASVVGPVRYLETINAFMSYKPWLG